MATWTIAKSQYNIARTLGNIFAVVHPGRRAFYLVLLMEGKQSFILFNDLEKPVKSLSNEDAGMLFKAIFEYQNGGIVQDLSPLAMMAFTFIQQQLDRSNDKYDAICERNRLNGAKGGRPPKPKKPSGLSGNPEKPKKPRRTLPDPDLNPKPDSKPKPQEKSVAKVDVDTEVYNSIKGAFESKHGVFDNYPKEGKAIKDLIRKAKARAPDKHENFLQMMVVAFWRLKGEGEKFWKDQPFLPSALNSLWARVMEHARDDVVDEEFEEIVRGAFCR